jgi:ABC-type antimicrobial peptide transport system permease subunit
MIMDRRKIRYGIAIFFILCGLIIGIVGGYGCVVVKHYKMPISDPRVSQYSGDISYNSITTIAATSLDRDWVDIDTRKTIEGLPFTTQSGFLWLPIIVGLAYIALGIWSLRKKDFLFEKEK